VVGLLTAVQEPPQARRDGFTSHFYYLLALHPHVGINVALVVGVAVGLLAAFLAETPRRKIFWGIVWFLGSAAFVAATPVFFLVTHLHPHQPGTSYGMLRSHFPIG